MIGSISRGKLYSLCCGKNLLALVLMAACLALASAGCGMMPRAINDLPSRMGLQSQDAELRAKVEADKFPTAKEAGL